jgi:hypothetical protein
MEIKHFLEKVSEDDFKWEKQYEVDVEEELTKGIENIKVSRQNWYVILQSTVAGKLTEMMIITATNI